METDVEGVTLAVEDLAKDIDRARRFGFGAQLRIDSSQTEAVTRGLSPTPGELD